MLPATPPATPPRTSPVLSVRDLTVRFGAFTAVDALSFDLHPGRTLAVVGESGSGKSVTALSIMRLIEFGSRASVDGGQVLFTRADGSTLDLLAADEPTLRRIRGEAISMIFQEPLTSLNPVYTLGEQVAEVLRFHRGASRADARREAVRLFDRVRIPQAARIASEYPHQISGGMRQRVMIAMALACDPRVIIADEPTTALDVTIQAQILGLLRELQRETDTAVMLITHDMGVVAEVADDIVVMRHSRLVETGSVHEVFERPRARYTRALLSSIPRLGSMAGTSEPAPFELVDADADEAVGADAGATRGTR